MSFKNKKPQYKEMSSVIKQCAKLNMNRIIFSVLMFYFVFMLLMFACTVPVLGFVNGSTGVNPSSSIFMSIILGLVTIFAFMLMYGLNIAVSKVIEREDGGFGILFSAFKSNTLKIFFSSVIFLIIDFIAISLSFLVFVFIYKNDEFFKSMQTSFSMDFVNENAAQLMNYVRVLSLFMYIALFFMSFPFVFVWLNLYTNPKQNIFKAFGKSVKMLFGKVFHFIGFEVYSSWKPLLVMIIARLISSFSPEKLTFLSDFASFIGFAAEIILIARVMLSYTVYYYFLTGNITVSNSKETDSSNLSITDFSEGN